MEFSAQRLLKRRSLSHPDEEPLLTIIHFNDVYDLQSRQGSMGVVNFKAKLDELKELYPNALVLFSGDCFSPSTLTNIKEGWQMVKALNTFSIDGACYGNHEFDFQKEHTLSLARACNFPWLLGNIEYTATGHLLGDGKAYLVKEVLGLKIGIMGIAGDDWIGILSDQYEDQLVYEDYRSFAVRTAEHLRTIQKCDLVIALTHMRNEADIHLVQNVEALDLVLGGHDHVVMEELINGTLVIKSGCNFNNIGLVHLWSSDSSKGIAGHHVRYKWQIFRITQAEKVDQGLKKYVDDLMEEYSRYDSIIGYTDVDLETRFEFIRKGESNYGDFIVDLARLYYDTNIAIINSGSIRNDCVIPVGRLSYSRISNIINSPLVVKKISGKVLLEVLQYSVSAMPGYSGAFLMVSGLSFQYDWKRTPRIVSVKIGNQPLDPEENYTMTTTSYQSRGGDGYQMLKNLQVLVDEVHATSTLNLLLKFFKASDCHQEYESIKYPQDTTNQDDGLPDFPIELIKLVKKPSVRIGRIKDLRSRFVLDEDGKRLTAICPSVQGRIRCLTIKD